MLFGKDDSSSSSSEENEEKLDQDVYGGQVSVKDATMAFDLLPIKSPQDTLIDKSIKDMN